MTVKPPLYLTEITYQVVNRLMCFEFACQPNVSKEEKKRKEKKKTEVRLLLLLYAIIPDPLLFLLCLLPLLAPYIAPPTFLTCYSCLRATWPGWTQLEAQKALPLLIQRQSLPPFLNLPGDSLAPFSITRTPFY